MDLIVFYSPEKACLTYYINNDSAGYKIEYPFSFIKNIELETHDVPTTNPSTGQQKQGQLVITLARPPNFFMDSSGSGGFYQCGDFTEDQQASQVLTHYLGGHPKILAGQLAKLVTLEAFANRHAHAAQFPMYEHPSFAASGPLSPHIIRPASSNDIPTWPPQELAPGHQFHQKHRRTRSRSVPVAIDFSQMQQNMPSFSFQDHNDQNEHLYAPAPMHPHALVNQALPGTPLRIDTSSSDFLDYRPGSTGYPLSATTASPSDYASPSMLNSALQHDVNSAGYGTPYSLPFLSPMQGPTNGVGQSMSPISMDGGPMIASGSPPLSHIDRSSSAELFHTYDHTGMSDDLSELYSKQSLSLSPPHMDDTEGMDMTQLMQFPMTHGLPPDHNGM
jgi:hypothetical protein